MWGAATTPCQPPGASRPGPKPPEQQTIHQSMKYPGLCALEITMCPNKEKSSEGKLKRQPQPGEIHRGTRDSKPPSSAKGPPTSVWAEPKARGPHQLETHPEPQQGAHHAPQRSDPLLVSSCPLQGEGQGPLERPGPPHPGQTIPCRGGSRRSRPFFCFSRQWPLINHFLAIIAVK